MSKKEKTIDVKIIDNKDARKNFNEMKQIKGVQITNKLNSGKIVDKNSDIFAFIQGSNCNPNGDPNMDDDIRYDYTTGRLQITRACFHNIVRMGLDRRYLKLFISRVYKKEFFDKHKRVPTSKDRVSIAIDDIILDFSGGLEDFFTCIDRGFGGVVTDKDKKNYINQKIMLLYIMIHLFL